MFSPVRWRRSLLTVCVLFWLASLAWAQPSLRDLRDFSRNFSVGEQLSGHNDASVRGIGMGGVLAALDSADPINPAQNAELDEWWGQVRFNNYVTAGRLEINGHLFKLGGPVGSARHPQGLSFHYQDLEADPIPQLVPLPPPLPFAPAGLVLSESDWGASYGRKVGRKVSVGLTIAGDVGVNWDLAIRPGVLGPRPTPVLSMAGEPRRGISGGRVGALYQANDDLRLGFFFSTGATEANVKSFLAPPPNVVSFAYDSWDVRLGAAYNLTPRTTVALDMQNGHVSGAGTSESSVMWFGGIEQRIGSGLAIRLGQSDGSLTTGVGYAGKPGWGVDYAYVNDRYRNSLQRLYGDTSGHFIALHSQF